MQQTNTRVSEAIYTLRSGKALVNQIYRTVRALKVHQSELLRMIQKESNDQIRVNLLGQLKEVRFKIKELPKAIDHFQLGENKRFARQMIRIYNDSFGLLK